MRRPVEVFCNRPLPWPLPCPGRMYGVMRQTSKPCFAFKILAAGRIADGGIEQAFRTAFSSIKPNDGLLVGDVPRGKDEVRENAEIVHRILQE